MIPTLNLKNVLINCAHAISEEDMYTAANFMEVLGLSVSGKPMQRLGAYMSEGLRARLEKSGSMIYKTLKCEVPTSEELMTYMSILYQICPYWKFAYLSSNVIMKQALVNEPRVHIIDFQIAQGSQYIPLIQDLACQPGGPPLIRITGVDDSQSNHARGGGLHIVGERLSEVAAKYNVPFEFNAAAMSGCEVELENLRIQPGEAIAVTFPYVLHHMPDESVSTENHRDRLLRLVWSLSPKVMTLIEHESNTNTSSFYSRFVESVDYYTALFESIDAGCPRDNKQRISAEMHCVARDIVNIIACEDAERVERHDLLEKWRSRLMMNGFTSCPFGPAGIGVIRNLLKDYNENYRVEEVDGVLYLGWKKRALVTSSAWRCAYSGMIIPMNNQHIDAYHAQTIVQSVCAKLQPVVEIDTGDLDSFEGTRQATVELEPSIPESSENVEAAAKVIRHGTTEIVPTMPNTTKNFEAVEATPRATDGNSSQFFGGPAEPAPQWKHDVFLSFRGEDTRKGFLSHLYRELQNTKLIRTFKDDEQLKKGKEISKSLLTAIEESRFAIIVLSKHYAFSTWCLDEVTKIFQCMEGRDTILPIFYHVDPSDVRYQTNNYEVAFTKHESKGRHAIDKVKQWRADLTKVGNLVGWDSKNHKSESELVEDIVKFVRQKVVEAPKGDFEEFEATKEAIVEVNKMLKDDKITAIGVYGRGGVGKTAMVKHVGEQAKRNGVFDHVVVSVLSRNPDLQKIQGALANQLGFELVEDVEIERASILKEKFMGGKKILIILDNIWEKIDMSSIGVPSYGELQSCNSKVLLITRIRNLCHLMGCQALIPLNILSEEDSLKLFMKKLRKPFHESTIDSCDEERNVVRECAGLPLVLEEAARGFGHKYVEEWNEAVSKAFSDNDNELLNAAPELETPQLVHTKDERDAFKGIKRSYHTLMFDDAKSLFLLCCMYPEDYDIPIEELFKYGIGNGLFQYSDTLQKARERANSMVTYLKASGLLLDGKKGCVRMHCDTRNEAMSIALSEEGHAFFVKAGCELKDWPMDAHEGCSAISLMRNQLNKLPETLVSFKLQILLLQNNAGISDIPETFFQCPNALRVFDLSYTGISVLPSSTNLLTDLQALHLDCCNRITDISVLGKLKKVEILSLRKFPHKELPEEIGNLTSLRMLDVTGGRVRKIPSKMISRLYRLEELYLKCEFGDWGSEVKEALGSQSNANFDEIISLSHLNILKVYISDAACLPTDIGNFELNWVKFDICISKDLSLEMLHSLNGQASGTLTLDRTINGLPDWFIKVVTQKAEHLEYRECKGEFNILKEHEHGSLHGLKRLSVVGCHVNLEELINATTWDPSKPVFESLEELHLLHLQRLKELCVGHLPLGSLCNLKLLKVQTCCSLVNALLPAKLLKRLINLEIIFCVNMERMKYVFGSEGLEHVTTLLTKLSEMRLGALFELRSIWNGPAPDAVFGNLKVLAVCECTKLKSLFPFDVARSLVQLEDLSVEHCPCLSRIIEASNRFLFALKASSRLKTYMVFPRMKKLALKNLPKLACFCIENTTVATECPSLEYLYVDECPQFINTAPASVKFNDQQHLNSIAKRWEDMHKL